MDNLRNYKCRYHQAWPCQNFACEENVFYWKLNLAHHYETEMTEKIGNCLINNVDEWTLDQIGKAWGLSRERIRQIEEKAMDKLKYSKSVRDSLTVFYERTIFRHREGGHID